MLIKYTTTCVILNINIISRDVVKPFFIELNPFLHRSCFYIFCLKTQSGRTNVNYTFYIYFRPQTSDCKPQALRESSYRQKKPETKPAGEMPLFDQLKTKMKERSRKLQVLFLRFSSPKYFCTSFEDSE